MLLGTIVSYKGIVCLRMAKHPNTHYPLRGNSRLAQNFMEHFICPASSDIGRELHQTDGKLHMEGPEG